MPLDKSAYSKINFLIYQSKHMFLTDWYENKKQFYAKLLAYLVNDLLLI